MPPPVSAVIAARARLAEQLVGLTDRQVAAASGLPGWSRGHVLAHLTDNARMFARLAEHALRGELVPTYDGGQQEREAIIEANAGRGAEDHRARLAEHTTHLESVWARMAEDDWCRPVMFRNADVAATVYARWREAWIHLVDLDIGVRPDDWPADLAAHAIDFLLIRLPPGVRLHAGDVDRQWSTGEQPGPIVTAQVRDLAAWLAGRTPATVPSSPGGLPVLGPWPPHPPPRSDRP